MLPTHRLAALLVVLLGSLWLCAPALAQDSQRIDIQVGKSTVQEFAGRVEAIAITDPEVARVQPLASTSRYQIQGVAVGTTDLIVTLEGGGQRTYEIIVLRDLSELVRRIASIVEGEPPEIYPLGEHLVVQGPVDDLDTLEQVAQVARIYDPEFVNLMSVRGDHQVQLEVIFAESSRRGLRELGVNLFVGTPRGFAATDGPNSIGLPSIVSPDFNGVAGGTLAQAPAAGAFDLMGTLNLGAFDLAGIFSITDDYRITKTLTQTSQVALSGQKAEFLSGGKIPVPAPGMAGMVMVQYEEYGTKLSFVPTVLAGDVIDLRVYVEVSDIDQGTTSRVAGLEIPGLLVQKAQSHVRLASGMTFAMAGLLTESTEYQKAQFPLLGDIPIVGNLFRYIRHQRDERELMIFVTPRLVRPMAPGEVPAAPGTTEDNNTSDIQFFLLGLDRRPGSRTAEPAGTIGLQR